MNDFSKIIAQAKNLQSKMKESQEKIKKIANMLHIENKDLMNVKMDIKRLF